MCNLDTVEKGAKDIHRGEALEKIVKRNPLSITFISKKAGFNRSSFYNHISKPDLSFEILERYGKALGFDFTKIFPVMDRYISFEDTGNAYPKVLTFDQLEMQRDQWRDKYYDLLERYNKLIEDKLDLGKKG